MMRGVKLAALFVLYGAIGYGGDQAMGLVAQEVRERFDGAIELPFAADDDAHVVEVHVPDVVVEVRPTIVSRVAVRHGEACSYRAERETSVAVDRGVRLTVHAGSGDLHVEGREGLEEVVVVGLLCASHEEYMSELDVRVERTAGGDVDVETLYPRERDDRWGDDVARIDLTVLVPLGLAVELDDSSGDIEVFGTGSLDIDDSSGDLRVRDIDGTLRIDDSSGGLEVENVTGDVDIVDGSGGLELSELRGSLRLRDGSGGIDIRRVEGDVVVFDGSGSIDVRDVGGDFIVESDGSGGIRHSGVRGRVDIPRDDR